METDSLKILILCDLRAEWPRTVADYLSSFEKHSRHKVFFCSPQSRIPFLDINAFDVVVLFYSVHPEYPHSMPRRWRGALASFKGLKVQFLQDEYRTFDLRCEWIKKLGIDVVFTCWPEDEMGRLYTREKVGDARLVSSLTGYVPFYFEDNPPDFEKERSIDVSYRARGSGLYWIGQLFQEKYWIGRDFAEYARKNTGLKCDISSREEDRLYGDAWINFLRDSRCTLGSGSGGSVVDFTGDIERSVKEYCAENPGATFEETRDKFFKDVDGIYKIDAISPRIFEAVGCGCCLILYEGGYSGVLSPDKHYIPLKKDMSNIADVVKKVEDREFCRRMARRAHEDIILSGKWSYSSFVKNFDQIVAEELRRKSTLKKSDPPLAELFPEEGVAPLRLALDALYGVYGFRNNFFGANKKHGFLFGREMSLLAESLRARASRGLSRLTGRRAARKGAVLFAGQSYYHCWYLAKELRKLGWKADVLNWDDNESQQIYYHGEDFSFRGKSLLRQLWFYFRAIPKYDIFHFSNAHCMSFGWMLQSHFNRGEFGKRLREVEFLKEQGKRIVYSNCGCLDGVSQSSYMKWDDGLTCGLCIWSKHKEVCSDERNLAWGRLRNSLADYQCTVGGNRADYNDDPSVHEVPAFYCLDPEFWRPDLAVPEKYKVRVPEGTVKLYHAVGNYDTRSDKRGKNIKCTHIYLDAIERLKSEGFKVELIFCKDVPNKDVRFYQVQADIILDMLTFGSYGANIREGLMLGKTCVCHIGQHYKDACRIEIPEFMEEMPVVDATPETVYEVLKDLIEHPEKRAEIGRRSREFALKWHSAEAGARHMDKVYSDLLASRPGTTLRERGRRIGCAARLAVGTTVMAVMFLKAKALNKAFAKGLSALSAVVGRIPARKKLKRVLSGLLQKK